MSREGYAIEASAGPWKVLACMNSHGLPADGVYTFNISVKTGTKTVKPGFEGGGR
jgi:hypothetical protein